MNVPVEISAPTFKVAQQPVGHVLVEILDTLGQLVCTQLLTRPQVGTSLLITLTSYACSECN